MTMLTMFIICAIWFVVGILLVTFTDNVARGIVNKLSTKNPEATIVKEFSDETVDTVSEIAALAVIIIASLFWPAVFAHKFIVRR